MPKNQPTRTTTPTMTINSAEVRATIVAARALLCRPCHRRQALSKIRTHRRSMSETLSDESDTPLWAAHESAINST